MPRRRPQAGTVLGAIAVFIALGGPAEAAKVINGSSLRKGSVTAKQIKAGTITGRLVKVASVPGNRLRNGTVEAEKLTPAAIATLTATPRDGVTGAHVADRSLSGADLADKAVGQQQLGRDSVGGVELGPDSVDTDEVVDGRLSVNDVASFAGSVVHDFGVLKSHECAAITRTARLISPRPNVTIADDAVLVTAPEGVADEVALTARPSGTSSIRFVLCNNISTDITVGQVTLRYLTVEF